MFRKFVLAALVFFSLSFVGCSVLGGDGVESKTAKRCANVVNEEDVAGRGQAEQTTSRAMMAPVGAGTAVSAAPRITKWAVLYYIPNRVLDLIEVPRFDVGMGISYGAVVRISRFAQFGYRGFAPYSVRLGLRGLKPPAFMERYPEGGIGPWFRNSRDRIVTPVEVGLGADLLLFGGYLGVSVDEFVDFLAGFIFLDPKRDDLRQKR